MIGIIIFLLIVVACETIIIAEILHHHSKPEFILWIDESDPDDVKMAIEAHCDVAPGRTYFIKAASGYLK